MPATRLRGSSAPQRPGRSSRRQISAGVAEDGEEQHMWHASGWTARLASVASRSSLLIIIAVLLLGFGVAAPHTFFVYSNFSSLLFTNGTLVLLALAETVPLRAGDFDLSVSSTAILSAAISAVMVLHGDGAGVAIVVALAAALVVGALNALLVVWARLNGFIATLGTMTIVTGAAYAVTNSNVVSGYSGALLTISQTQWFGISTATYVCWIVAVLLLYVFEFTMVGRSWLFIGGNLAAAELIGLPVRGLRASAYLVSGLLSGVAGVVLAGSLGSVDPSTGGQYLLIPFAAAFLGTIAVTVGRFNVIGTLLGVYTLLITQLGLNIVGAPVWFTNIFTGGTLVVALIVAGFTTGGSWSGILRRITRTVRQSKQVSADVKPVDTDRGAL
jgi:ribose transport system permease protein